MGWHRHHAVIVQSWDMAAAEEAHAKATAIYATHLGHLLASPIVESATNGGGSFFIAPDNSKEGWGTSEQSDEARAAFLRWLDAQRHEDGSSRLRWCEVVFGDDMTGEARVLQDDDHPLAAAPEIGF
jgi:hypothetical protein